MPTYEVRIKVITYYTTEVIGDDDELAAENALEEFYRLTPEDRRCCYEDGDTEVESISKVDRYNLPYDEDARHERMLNN